MQENKVERIVFVDDREYKLNNDILEEYIIVTNGGNANIENTNITEVCLFNGGACLITFIGVDKEQEIDSSSLDVPSSISFMTSYSKGKKFLSDVEDISPSKVETQRVVQIYKDGKPATSLIAIIEYYKAEKSESPWKLTDENGVLI